LSNLSIKDGIIWSVIPFAVRKAANLVEFHESGMSNMLLTVPEANVSAAFTELADGKVEVSMRARPGYNIATVALSLGGGGHPAAAGCTIDGPLEAAVERVIHLIRTTAKAG
jgi:phosphoesterase RecJ-like protein